MVHLVRVEDEIELAHILETSVQRLHKHLNQIKNAQFTLAAIYDKNEVQGGVMSVDEFRFFAIDASAFEEITERVCSF